MEMYERVEYLRRKMIVLAEEKGSLVHPEVVSVSQELDVFLVQIQRRQLKTCFNSPKASSTFYIKCKSILKYASGFRDFIANCFATYAV